MLEKIKNKIKEFAYLNDEFSFAQKQRNRKWYGGEWNKLYNKELKIYAWVQGEPDESLLERFEIVETENWG